MLNAPSVAGGESFKLGNGVTNAPGGYTFNGSDKNVANSQNHSAGAGQGVWLELTLAAGAAAAKTSYTLRETGETV